MSHNEVYRAFCSLMPHYEENVEVWFLNGKNSIRIRMNDKSEYVFTISNDGSWRFETLKNFLKELKGRTKGVHQM